MWSQSWGGMTAIGFWSAVALGALLVVVGRRFLARQPRPRAVGFLALALASLLPISGAIAALPFVFTNGTVADATQVNANFAALSASFVYRSAASVAINLPPGVTVAHLSLPTGGQWILQAKLRFQSADSLEQEQASCVFQGSGVAGVDASSATVPVGSEVDGFMMDYVDKRPANSTPDVHIQCTGNPPLAVSNIVFVAIPVPSATVTP
jgi:hypothetical protein